MIDLSTNYLGLELRSPLVISSSPLCENVDDLKLMEDCGAGAVVLPSLFEEQIELECDDLDRMLGIGAESTAEVSHYFPNMGEYNLGPQGYLDLIQRAKAALDIPVIASLNGNKLGWWLQYAEMMQAAGADALELNLYDVPTDAQRDSTHLEFDYTQLVSQLRSHISIPFAVKISYAFTSPAAFALRIAKAGANGIVIFNRFYQPDFDLERLEIVPRLHLSQSNELPLRLHWAAIMFGQVPLDISITGGVHTHHDVLKSMMAGAKVVMLTSVLMTHGIDYVRNIELGMRQWMLEHDYESIQQMQGSMSMRSVPDPAAYERGNYMKVLRSYILKNR